MTCRTPAPSPRAGPEAGATALRLGSLRSPSLRSVAPASGHPGDTGHPLAPEGPCRHHRPPTLTSTLTPKTPSQGVDFL